MVASSDTALALRAREGDKHALDELLRRAAPRIARQLRRYPLGAADREDTLQNVLVHVTRRLATFRGEAQVETWIASVTTNEALMAMRTNRRRSARCLVGGDDADLEEPADEYPSPEVALIEADRDAHVRDAIDLLPDEQRAVLLARYHHGLEPTEIAHREGASATAVRSRLHRARAGLRELLDCCSPITPNDRAA